MVPVQKLTDPNTEDESTEEKDRPADLLTERAKEKMREDAQFVPVIIKRSDETRRHTDDILEGTIVEGLEQLNRGAFSLFLSAIPAGLILGFSAMAVGIVQSYFPAESYGMLERFLTALVYPLGFVVCIMSGSELFTEHTATAVYPVLDRRAKPWCLLRLWAVVLAGNLIGALGVSYLLVSVDEIVGAKSGYIDVGHHLITYANQPLFLSSVLAGWLMAQGAWLIMSTPAALSQVICIFIVTFLIGLGSLHHAIAGSVEMFTALFISDEFTFGQALRFITISVLGNLAGGSCFVALLNYAHVRRSRTLAAPES